MAQVSVCLGDFGLDREGRIPRRGRQAEAAPTAHAAPGRDEASIQPVAQPNRSSATGPIDTYPGGTFLHQINAPAERTQGRWVERAKTWKAGRQENRIELLAVCGLRMGSRGLAPPAQVRAPVPADRGAYRPVISIRFRTPRPARPCRDSRPLTARRCAPPQKMAGLGASPCPSRGAGRALGSSR